MLLPLASDCPPASRRQGASQSALHRDERVAVLTADLVHCIDRLPSRQLCHVLLGAAAMQHRDASLLDAVCDHAATSSDAAHKHSNRFP